MNIMKIYALLLAAFITAGTMSNPTEDLKKDFQGVIVYTIEYLELPDEVKGMESMLPQETSMTMSGDIEKVEQSVMGGSQIVISNTKTGESHILMDMMGQKLDIFLSAEEAKAAEEEAGDPTVVNKGDQKTIQGYKCRLAEVTDGEGNVQLVYYTKSIKVKHNNFTHLDGFPLEYQTSQNNMKLNMVATEVKKRKVDASEFEVPEGYTPMTMDELNSMMGGN